MADKDRVTWPPEAQLFTFCHTDVQMDIQTSAMPPSFVMRYSGKFCESDVHLSRQET